jgi:hypothetical protein
VIERPFRVGTFSSDGRNFDTGSMIDTSCLSTMSASSVAVKSFVVEPISKFYEWSALLDWQLQPLPWHLPPPWFASDYLSDQLNRVARQLGSRPSLK